GVESRIRRNTWGTPDAGEQLQEDDAVTVAFAPGGFRLEGDRIPGNLLVELSIELGDAALELLGLGRVAVLAESRGEDLQHRHLLSGCGGLIERLLGLLGVVESEGGELVRGGKELGDRLQSGKLHFRSMGGGGLNKL